MAKQPCYFLALPKELRLQIYEYLLRPDCIQLHSYDHETLAADATVYYADMDRILPRSLHPQILRTCRQVVDEAQATLYAPDHLRLKPAVRRYDFLNMNLLARPFPASRLCQNRSLQTLTVKFCTSFATMAADLLHSIGLAELLDEKRVRELKLVVNDAWWLSLNKGLSEEIMVSLEDMIRTWMTTVKAERVRVQAGCGFGCSRIWCKYGNGEWYETPESHLGDNYNAIARSERLVRGCEERIRVRHVCRRMKLEGMPGSQCSKVV
ncbi:hypothetical protein LTR15_000562 [Elasticomyces elasticus]|nr:hypothetical protein LTR15_000562 [Elasticomyces elasticus]